MLRIAMAYKNLDVFITLLCIVLVLMSIVAFSIYKDDGRGKYGASQKMHILNRIDDPSVLIRGMVLLPWTASTYVPKYAYYKGDTLRTTFSYRKCKRNTQRA